VKIVIILVVLAVLGGGGAWYFLSQGDEAAAPAETALAAEIPEPMYVPVGQIAVPVFRDDALYAQFIVEIVLEVADGPTKEQAYGRVTELRNAYLREFYDVAERIAHTDEFVDLDWLTERLRVATVTVLGAEALRAVLLQNVLIQEV
jgi:flagellar basal body-associated protein FliL